MLVHLGYLSHLLIGQREVEDVDILRHALLMARLGYSHDATLSKPTEGYLSSSLVVFGTFLCQIDEWDFGFTNCAIVFTFYRNRSFIYKIMCNYCYYEEQ